MLELFTGHSLWEYITVLFDNIVKIVYLIYTAIASSLDLLQCLMRKLAGLDTYWVNGQAYVQQDPILEFIYGMLGIGPNAGTYSALSVVFWSLAIFAVIVLVISTMVAIIKAHYNEDSNKTNPLTHIYTAIKSVFTFAIVPVAVILGIYISQFLLQTMDNITAGKATEETIRGIYGDTAAQEFIGSDGVYTRYDFFGAGPKSTSQTFSGLLFRVAGYDANRVRRGDYDVATMQAAGGPSRVFGNTTQTTKPSTTSDQDWIAYQIDYAFMNNLRLRGDIWAEELYVSNNAAGIADVLITIGGVDFFTFVGGSQGFSKYNVGLVWYYYYLWSFNFFVGFASIIISFGLLTSIIIGLMSRLIFGAALFLIYAPTLGLAPLDDWRAFKEWRKKFIAQILMAFGSIIGINVFFLILPYVNEISWFNFAIADYIVNTLIIIVGLLTVKEFIKFVSGLIGADDASSTGEGMKKSLTETLAKTGGAVLGAANIGMKIGNPLLGAGVKAALAKDAQFRVERMDNQIHDASLQQDRADAAVKSAQADNASIAAQYMEMDPNASTTPASYQAEFKKFETRAKAQGVFEGSDAYNSMKAEFVNDYLSNSNSDYKSNLAIIKDGGYKAAHMTDEEIEQAKELPELRTKRQQLISQHYLNEDTGKMDFGTFRQLGKKWSGDIVGALVKGLKEGTKELTGIDTKAISGVFKRVNNIKYDDKGNAVGTYGYAQDNHTWRDPNTRQTIGDTVRTLRRGIGNILSPAGAPPPPKPEDSDKRLVKSADKIEKASDALLKAVDRLTRYKP